MVFIHPSGKAIAHPRDVHQARALRAHVHEGAEVPRYGGGIFGEGRGSGWQIMGKPWENHRNRKMEVFMGKP